jgi:hypothetical protein
MHHRSGGGDRYLKKRNDLEFYNLMTGKIIDGVAAKEFLEGNGNGLLTITIV